MEFEKKYGTKFWLLLDSAAEEVEKYTDVLSGMKRIENMEKEDVDLLRQAEITVSPEKELEFRQLADKACNMAEKCCMDIRVMRTKHTRGIIELKSDMIMLFSSEAREIMAELLRSASEAYIDAVDGEVVLRLWYEIFGCITK